MEEGQLDSLLVGYCMQCLLSDIQPPTGSEIPAVFRTIGITHHDDLPVTLGVQIVAIDRVGQNRFQCLRRPLQIIDLLKQRNDL